MVLIQEQVEEAVPISTVGMMNFPVPVPIHIPIENVGFRYRECTKNKAAAVNLKAYDGCQEFMPAGEAGTLEAFSCAACGCHRNFHRMEPQGPKRQEYCYHLSSAGYFRMMAPHPSSSGASASSSKRHRTKFSQAQKDRMLAFAQGLGWRVKKEHEASVQELCAEIGINRKVLKAWLHNNKHTLGKMP